MQTKFVLLEKTHFFSDAIEYGNLYQTGYDYIGGDYDQAIAGLPRYSRSVFKMSLPKNSTNILDNTQTNLRLHRLLIVLTAHMVIQRLVFIHQDIKVFGEKDHKSAIIL